MTDRLTPADFFFQQYWSIHFVQQFTLIERPDAWLMFQLSLTAQHKVDPFDTD